MEKMASVAIENIEKVVQKHNPMFCYGVTKSIYS